MKAYVLVVAEHPFQRPVDFQLRPDQMDPDPFFSATLEQAMQNLHARGIDVIYSGHENVYADEPRSGLKQFEHSALESRRDEVVERAVGPDDQAIRMQGRQRPGITVAQACIRMPTQ